MNNVKLHIVGHFTRTDTRTHACGEPVKGGLDTYTRTIDVDVTSELETPDAVSVADPSVHVTAPPGFAEYLAGYLREVAEGKTPVVSSVYAEALAKILDGLAGSVRKS